MSFAPNVSCADETVATLLAREPRAARVLLSHAMHCVGCAIAPFETLGEICAIYGVPLQQLLVDLRDHCASETRETNMNSTTTATVYRRCLDRSEEGESDAKSADSTPEIVKPSEARDIVDEASYQSFPASDPPSWTFGVDQK